MNIDLSLTNITLACITFVATSYVCWQSCYRSGFKPATLLMEALRFLLVGLAAFTLFQPTFVLQTDSEGDSVVKVLIDDSGSMDTEDIELQDGKLQSRAAAIAGLASEETWQTITDQSTVEIETFAAQHAADKEDTATDPETAQPYTQSATDLHQSLDQIASNPGDVRAVVLASDGDWNIGESPATAARKLRQLGIQVHTIGAGSPTALPDLAVTNFALPTFAIVGKPLRIPFSVTSTLKVPVDVDITVELPGGATRTVPVQVPAGGVVEHVVSWRPAKIGSYEISIRIPEHPTERVVANNVQTLPISVRYESLRVLMIDSYPRWEYRYTRNALMRDPGVTVNTLLLHPDVEENGGGPGYLNSFPANDELTKYDAIFLGDVGIGAGQLTKQNCEALIKHVRNQAAGLIFLPGFRGFQNSLQGTDIEELIPVEMDPAVPKGVRSGTEIGFRLTEAGSESLLTRLEADSEKNTMTWNSLPGFFWHASVIRAKPNTSVLAVHGTKNNRFGRLPMIVTRTYGAGKVLFVGSDSAWRWRRGVEDLYHYRFWSQMVRWMAYQRTMAAGDSMRVIFTPDRPRTGDTVNVLVNAMDANGEPLQSGTVTTQVLMPSGKSKTLNLKSDSKQSWGLFRSSFVADEGGTLKLLTRCRETNDQLETKINIRGVPREVIGKPARLDVMQEIASITQGTASNIKNDDLSVVLDAIENLPSLEATQQHYQLWSHPMWGLSLIVLLGVFWGIRKAQGLI